MLVWLNGRVVDARRATVSVLDRGLLHGDGCYDTWRTYDGIPYATAAHVRRLARTARALGLPAPDPPSVWAGRARRLVARNRLRDAAVRLTLTRGTAGLDVLPSRPRRPTVLLTVRPLPPDLEQRRRDGVACTLLPWGRDAGGPWGGHKLIGHVSAVLGRVEADRRGAREGLYVREGGEITEGTTTSVFVVRGRTLVTPPLTHGILPGLTRTHILRLARRAGLRTRERPLPCPMLHDVDEAFITAATIEVLPVVRVDRVRIGDGRPGPVTRHLQTLYRAAALRACARARRSGAP